MFANDINEKYIEIVTSDREKYYEDYLKTKELVRNSSAIYEGKPVPFLYNPMFFTENEIESFDKATSTLMTILNKVIKKYTESPSFRRKFGYSKELEELILVDHEYGYNVPMARFDIFYDDDNNFKFCELNADGSSAMNETNVLERIFMETKAVEEIKKEYDLEYKELVYKWVKESIEIYRSWGGEKDNPNVAIVDFEGAKTINEFKEFQRAYIKWGCKAEIVDPRRLKYMDGKLYFGDMKIDLIYRRLVTGELMKKYDELGEFIKGYKNGAACFVGPIRSQIIHNKIIFKILHDEDTLSFLEDAEKEFVKRHIPYTAEFTDEVYNNVLNNKEKYVLKPKDLYASKGVYLGIDLSQEEWKRKLEECLNNDYLVQEFVMPYEKKMVEFNDGGECNIFDFKHIIGLYMYKERFVGIYTRVSQNNIISSFHGCYTVPNLIVKKK
ncbi:MAG: hypothetical protein PWQ37_1099 [Candidatus Petromonas sp.]|jgi:glutathionylspermidine synthase|nr:hypothetical protein [Candidatus Petromonas sp.]